MTCAALMALLLTGSGADVARITRGAQDFSPAQYSAAMDQLAKVGPSAGVGLAALLDAREYQHEYAQAFLCDALARFPAREALPALRPRITDERWMVRTTCIEAFGAAVVASPSDEDLKRLRQRMRDEPICAIRGAAAEWLGRLGAGGLNAELEPMLAGTACEKAIAVRGLAWRRDGREAQGAVFVKLLADPREAIDVREWAARAVAQLGYAGARATLVALLSGPDPGMNLRSFAIDALGDVGTRDDLPALKKVIASDPYKGIGVWAVSGRAAVRKIEARAGGRPNQPR